ncbi:type 4a pilus biogenesis protein PilO [Planomonospora corallina]|uniref:Type 4a pilus biogenesis protein PilO n=1 Tax=Planomonospora corallina TaxID=1806052 RepID=A0ABV8I1Z7_9ACTN
MISGRKDRLWMIGGLLAAVLLLLSGWFVLISPEMDEADRLQADAETMQVQMATLRSKLADLRRENENLPRYRAELATARQALPTTADSEKFLRQLQQAGEATDAFVQGVNVGDPVQTEASGAQMHYLPVAVTVTGSAAEVEAFLDEIQHDQPRAVLVTSLTAQAEDGGGDGAEDSGGGTLADGQSTVVNLKIFVASQVPAETAADAPAETASPDTAAQGS